MIEGSGKIISKQDEEGYDIPFLTTDQILKQIEKFGFLVYYNVKSNLPDATLDFLQSAMRLNYDKINRIMLQTTSNYGETIWKPTVVIYKSVDMNVDLMKYGVKVLRSKYLEKVDAGTLINVNEENIDWDWVDSFYNLSDIMDENADMPDPFETDTEAESGHETHPIFPVPTDPENFTPYDSEDADNDDEDDDNDEP